LSIKAVVWFKKLPLIYLIRTSYPRAYKALSTLLFRKGYCSGKAHPIISPIILNPK